MAADLQAIRTKIRRLTRMVSPNQISDAEIDDYINTFYMYDLPESIRLFSLKRTLNFYSQPNVDVYETGSVAGLEGFKDLYITNESPAYIAGIQVYMSQSREEFFGMFPLVSYRHDIATGDGVNNTFSGSLDNVPILQEDISFVSEDANGNALILEGVKNPALVNPNVEGDLYEPGGTVLAGGINYIDGDYLFNFYLNDVLTPPASGAKIQAQTRPYVPQLPQAILYYDNAFTLRPVPDKAYKITIDAYIRPTALLASADRPVLEQWWQYLAYGAAKKIFEDRADMDSVQMILPEFNKQEKFVLRRTLVQQSTQQAATIYNTQGTGYWNSNGWWNNNF